jgi:hypothetical protein
MGKNEKEQVLDLICSSWPMVLRTIVSKRQFLQQADMSQAFAYD